MYIYTYIYVYICKYIYIYIYTYISDLLWMVADVKLIGGTPTEMQNSHT